MKAAILKQLDKPLEITDVTEPELIANGVKVKVLGSYVMSFTKRVFSKGYKFTPPVPYIPGLCAVGIIEAVADDVTGLTPGQKVFCTPNYRSPTNRTVDDSILIGWFGLTPNSEKLLSIWKNGSFAEKAVYPSQCVTPILDNEYQAPAQLCVINVLSIAYGALLNSGFKPSQTVVINGATGNIGAAAVVLALALGAAKVIAVGRDEDTLATLQQLDERVITHVLNNDIEKNIKQLSDLAEERHVLIDVSSADAPGPTTACIQALSPGGVAVLAGGVVADIALPYGVILGKQLTIKGSFMYPDYAITDLLRLIGNGQIDLNLFKINVFPLDEINQAIEKASSCKGLECCIVSPD